MVQCAPRAKDQPPPRQVPQDMRLNRADNGRWLTLRGHKIEPAPGIETIKRQPQHAIRQGVRLAEIAEEPAIYLCVTNSLLKAFLVHRFLLKILSVMIGSHYRL